MKQSLLKIIKALAILYDVFIMLAIWSIVALLFALFLTKGSLTLTIGY